MKPKRRLRDQMGHPATVLGHGARIKGTISGSGHFLVAGEFDGDADVDGAVTLAEGSRWQGTIRAQDVVLAGEFDGELHARGRIELTPSARVKGSITGTSIAMAQGAVVDGDVRVVAEGDVQHFEEQRSIS